MSEKSPSLNAFTDERALPAEVLGPRDFLPFSRLARRWTPCSLTSEENLARHPAPGRKTGAGFTGTSSSSVYNSAVLPFDVFFKTNPSEAGMNPQKHSLTTDPQTNRVFFRVRNPENRAGLAHRPAQRRELPRTQGDSARLSASTLHRGARCSTWRHDVGHRYISPVFIMRLPDRSPIDNAAPIQIRAPPDPRRINPGNRTSRHHRQASKSGSCWAN